MGGQRLEPVPGVLTSKKLIEESLKASERMNSFSIWIPVLLGPILLETKP